MSQLNILRESDQTTTDLCKELVRKIDQVVMDKADLVDAKQAIWMTITAAATMFKVAVFALEAAIEVSKHKGSEAELLKKVAEEPDLQQRFMLAGKLAQEFVESICPEEFDKLKARAQNKIRAKLEEAKPKAADQAAALTAKLEALAKEVAALKAAPEKAVEAEPDPVVIEVDDKGVATVLD